jgi:glutathione S-transferase
MMDALTLYTNPMSRGRIVRWMMEEVGQPYETKVLEFGPAMRSPAYQALNPMGKVPTLTHGSRVITEVAAICTYLADAFPDAGLMPEDHASFYRWMFFGAGPLEHAVVNTSFGWAPATPQEEGRVGYGALGRVVATLAGHLAGRKFIVGDRFSAADVYVGSQIGWGLRFNTLPANDALQAYWDGLKSRPALARALAQDEALMKKE